MKKIISIFLYSIGVVAPLTLSAQGLQVNPPASAEKNTVFIPHGPYPSNFFFGEPHILSIDINESGDQIIKLQQSSGVKSLVMTDVQSGNISEIKIHNISLASQVYYLNDAHLAVAIAGPSPSFDIIEIKKGEVIASINSNHFIGSTSKIAYFSNQSGEGATIEKFDFSTKKLGPASKITGEIIGWYFSEGKGIVGVALHSNMLSKIYSFENEKLGKKLFEFSSNYYFETKGCDSNGEIFYGITNFQSSTTYACAISKSGIKPIKITPGHSCTDIYVHNNDIVISTNNLNAAEYQESKNLSIKNLLSFANNAAKGSSVEIISYSKKNNSLLFCLQSETTKPKYFVWANDAAIPVSSDKLESKNLSYISSEIVEFQTSESLPQTGRMYLPTNSDKSTYPLIIYIPRNIFLPYPNEFNPMVQHLCQSGYAVFVWNTRYTYRPKTGFTYADLAANFPDDIDVLCENLSKKYSLLMDSKVFFANGLASHITLAGTIGKKGIKGIALCAAEFAGTKYLQDRNAALLFGEDAQSNWKTIDRYDLSHDLNYFSLNSNSNSMNIRLNNKAKSEKLKWNISNSQSTSTPSILSHKEITETTIWLSRFINFETKIIENSPKVEVKKK